MKSLDIKKKSIKPEEKIRTASILYFPLRTWLCTIKPEGILCAKL